MNICFAPARSSACLMTYILSLCMACVPATPTGLLEDDISVTTGSPDVQALTVRETITTIRDGKVANERVRDRQATTSEVDVKRAGMVPMTIRAIDVGGREQVFRHTEATTHGNVDMNIVVSSDGAVRQVVAKRQGEVVR